MSVHHLAGRQCVVTRFDNVDSLAVSSVGCDLLGLPIHRMKNLVISFIASLDLFDDCRGRGRKSDCLLVLGVNRLAVDVELNRVSFNSGHRRTILPATPVVGRGELVGCAVATCQERQVLNGGVVVLAWLA